MPNWKPLGLSLSTFLIFSSLAYFLFTSWNHHSLRQARPKYESLTTFHAPSPNPWAELDASEAHHLIEFLHKPPNPLNLTKSPTGLGKENYIAFVELLRPNKSDVVSHLDQQAPPPDRWARVCLVENTKNDGYLVDYMVGPLPPSEDTQILPLSYPYNSARNHVRAPVTTGFDLLGWALNIGQNISDITQDLLGAQVNLLDPLDPNALFIGSRIAMIDSGQMVQWLEFFRAGSRSDARSMLPQGLYVKLNALMPNADSWTTSQWYYNRIIYADLDSFRGAWASPNFTKTTTNLDGPWTDTEDFASNSEARSKPPPLSIQPYGARYDLDRKQNYVSWMGFTFYYSTSQFTAMDLFDIRFNNSRIIYHLGLQEALAHYAGSEPVQSGLEFLDTLFGMGSLMFSLVPGHDCPAYADYIDVTYTAGENTLTNENAICLFEYTSDAPLQRHTSNDGVTVSRNTYLVLRSVSTVGNYDYTIDYLFYLDGSMEVKVRASGFIFTAFAGEPETAEAADTPPSRAEPNEYGYQIHDAAMTSIHDHVLNFRADFDVAGTKNSLIRTSIQPLSKTYPWDKPEIASPRNTMHLTHETLAIETPLNWPRNSAAMYLIQSNTTNPWGEHRSYRIQPGTGMGAPSHLTILNSTTLDRSAAWSAADLWVLRNHPETEPTGAHPMNYLEPADPLVDFAKMLDEESIEEEDLVVYFNLGGHHVPHSGDIPNTLMHTSASSVIFSPFNYFDHDVSLHTRQGVRVDRREKEEDQVRYFGGRYNGKEKVVLGAEELDPDLSGYMMGEEGEVMENKVGGGLLGLYGGRNGLLGLSRAQEKAAGAEGGEGELRE